MWPVLLDMTKEESMQSLRNLELEAYAHLVSALRAQGPLNPDKRKLLKETSQVLNIPQDRHKAEIRRAINDERLNTIAYHVTGVTESLEDWAQEGRRSVPLIPRMAPQTAYSAIADEVAETASQTNKQLPHPANTERKRPPSQPLQLLMTETSKGASFRIPEMPKCEESKKRKLPICTENSSLAQHLLGPPKMSRPQQIYRQRAKAMLKEHPMKLKSPTPLKSPYSPQNGPKFGGEETIEQIQNEINSYSVQKNEASSANENQAPRPKIITTKPPLAFKQISAMATSQGGELSTKTLKVCPKKTVVTKSQTTPSGGQKLIVVSNAQTIQNSSILQKTLTIPVVKNISVKNFEKFKIVTTSSSQVVSTTGCNINSFKHKVVTVKTNPTTKKVIPLSLINSKGGIKVLPIGGKIVGKTTTAATASPPLYIVNTVSAKNLPTAQLPVFEETATNKENGKSSVLGDILKASGVTTDDFDSQIEEFRIPNNHMSEQAEGENSNISSLGETPVERLGKVQQSEGVKEVEQLGMCQEEAVIVEAEKSELKQSENTELVNVSEEAN